MGREEDVGIEGRVKRGNDGTMKMGIGKGKGVRMEGE